MIFCLESDLKKIAMKGRNINSRVNTTDSVAVPTNTLSLKSGAVVVAVVGVVVVGVAVVGGWVAAITTFG